jgi:hypothetical protein
MVQEVAIVAVTVRVPAAVVVANALPANATANIRTESLNASFIVFLSLISNSILLMVQSACFVRRNLNPSWSVAASDKQGIPVRSRTPAATLFRGSSVAIVLCNWEPAKPLKEMEYENFFISAVKELLT